MKHTKIEYCTHTWNPVSGCHFGCRYCYAASVAGRFGDEQTAEMGEPGSLHVLDNPVMKANGKASAFPFRFDPTLYRYRLLDYQRAAPANIFVSSTGDLFGEWIPDSWLEEVFQAALGAPQHNYLFLTKNPKRYRRLPFGISQKNRPKNMFFGTTVTQRSDILSLVQTLQDYPRIPLNFLSVEPILEDIDLPEFLHYHPARLEWVIVGAETGKTNGRVYPDRTWIEQIMAPCYKHEIPIFMKTGENNQIRSLMSSDFVQQYPEQLKKNIKIPERMIHYGNFK